METAYTRNASERMAEQQVSPSEVEQVLANPANKTSETRSGNTIYTGDVNGRPLRVVVEEGSSENNEPSPRTVLTLWPA